MEGIDPKTRWRKKRRVGGQTAEGGVEMVYMGPQLNGDEEKGDYIYFFQKKKKKKEKKKRERTETKDDCFGHG